MSKRFAVLCACLSMAFAIGGCGKSEQPTDESAKQTSTQTDVVDVSAGWSFDGEKATSVLDDDESSEVSTFLADNNRTVVEHVAFCVDGEDTVKDVYLCQTKLEDGFGWSFVTMEPDASEGVVVEYMIDPWDLYTTETWEGVEGVNGWRQPDITGVDDSYEAPDVQKVIDEYLSQSMRLDGDNIILGKVGSHESKYSGAIDSVYLVETVSGEKKPVWTFVTVSAGDIDTFVSDAAYADLMAYFKW